MEENIRNWIVRRADLLIEECGVSPPVAFESAAKAALQKNTDAGDAGDTSGCDQEMKRKLEAVYKSISDIAKYAGVDEDRVGDWLLGRVIPDYYEY